MDGDFGVKMPLHLVAFWHRKSGIWGQNSMALNGIIHRALIFWGKNATFCLVFQEKVDFS